MTFLHLISAYLGAYIIPDITSMIGVKSRDVASVSVACEKCGLTGELVPELPVQDLTVNGALVANDKCPKCGGAMKSAMGSYIFKEGKLVFSV